MVMVKWSKDGDFVGFWGLKLTESFVVMKTA